MSQKVLTRKKIYLRDTDATGVLYFTEQLRMALEVLEEYISLKEMLEEGKFLMPIVHAEADYFAPLRVGDEVGISFEVTRLGTKSLTLSYTFFSQDVEVGKVSMVHVAVDASTFQPIPLPQKMIETLTTRF
jgi:1,4-dihydroxy-2-naphthoyl-CoA hydrolase